MRILFFGSSDWCGAARSEAAIAALRAAGHEVIAILNDRRRPLPSILSAFLDYLRTALLLRRLTPALVYVHDARHRFGGVVAATRAGAPVLVDLTADVDPPGTGGWFGRLAERSVLRLSDRLIVPTRVQQAELVGCGVHPARIAVCAGAVDGSTFQPTWRKRSGRVTVGFVGPLDRETVGVLSEMMRRVRAVDGRIGFLVVGNGPAVRRLKRAMRPLGDAARLLPCREPEALPALLDAMDIVVAAPHGPSASPPLLLEQMAMEAAVVAFDTPAAREIIDHEVTGMLVPGGSHAALADTVLRLVREPLLRYRLAVDARRAVLRRYGWGARTLLVAEVYREIRLASAPIALPLYRPVLP